MEAFPGWSTCLYSKVQFSAEFCGRRETSGQRCMSEFQKQQQQQRQILVKTSHHGMSTMTTSSTGTRLLSSLSSSIGEEKRLMGQPLLQAKKRVSAPEEFSLSRLNEELVRRAVKAEKEPKEQKDKDDDGESKTTDEQDNQLWAGGARSMQSTLNIFVSMLMWVVLFFMASIFDGKGTDRPRMGRGDRRKK